MSPLILDAVTRKLDLSDRLTTENWEGAKRSLDAGFLGAPPLFRRACRGVLKGRYEQAALMVPALTLFAVATPASLATLPTIGMLNELRRKPRSQEAVWEHRFCLAVDGHLTSIWGQTRQTVHMEHQFIDWVKNELTQKPDRLRYSEKVWWHMRKWSKQLSMRENMLPP